MMQAAAAPVRGARLLAVYALCLAAALSPLLWAKVPPLVDFPNHIARAWVVTHVASVPDIAANYTVHWRVLPDLALESVVWVLAHVMPVELAGRLFLAAALLLLMTGTALLHRALHGRVGLWPLFAVLGLYNTVLFWGFASCLFTIGLALIAFAGWVGARDWRLPARIALFAPAAAVLLLGHLFAFGLFALLAASFELGHLLTLRPLRWQALVRAALSGLAFVPSLGLYYLSLGHTGSTHTEYGNPLTKLIALLAPYTFGHGPVPLDMAMWLFGIGVLCFGLTRRRLHVAPAMRVPLIVAVLMPNWMSGAWAADLRLPVALTFLVVASTEPQGVRPALRTTVTVAAVVLMALRIWSVSQSFASYDRWFDEFRAASAVVPPGARLLVIEPDLADPPQAIPGLPKALGRVQGVQFIHMPALAVADRSAFFPYMFTGWTIVDVTPRNAGAAERQGVAMTPADVALSLDPAKAAQVAAMIDSVGEPPYWHNWPADFDYAFWMSYHPETETVPPNLLPLVHGSYFTIFKIQH